MSPSSLNNPTLESQESKDRVKGIIASVIAHALIVVLLIFLGTYSGNPPLQDNEVGVPVDFGTSDVGSGDVQPESTNPVTQANEPQPPTPQVAQPVQPEVKAKDNVVTQQTEEAPVAMDDAKKTTKPVKEEKAPVKQATEPVKAAPPVATAPKGPEVNPNAIMGKPSTQNKSGNQGNDPNGTQGDKGVPWGDKGDVYTGPNGTGTVPGGNGGGHDFFLSGRKMLFKPKLVGTIQESGTVVISITVDQKGNVTDVDCCKAKGTTTSNQALISKAMEDAKKIKFDANNAAPDKQYGTVTFTFKLQ